MHIDATATRIEDLQLERAFEEKYGREMTLEEKKFIGLSDEMFKHEPLVEPLNRRFEYADNGSRVTQFPRRPAVDRQRKKVA
jgi:hypothetical protein